MTKSPLVDILMHVHVETSQAVLASDDGEKKNAVWLPLSQIEIHKRGSHVNITMPEWLAREKGLI